MDKLFKTINIIIPDLFKAHAASALINSLLLKSAYSQRTGPVTQTEIANVLREKFPQAIVISVEDTSGGCGAMFNISIETSEFKGLSVMKQHRLVYDILKEQINNIHGLHLETKATK